MFANEAMSSTVLTCSPTTNLDTVARLMWEGDCGAVPVVTDNNRPVGMITDRDITMAAMLNHLPLWEIPAATVIQDQRLVCCSQGETLEDCLVRMEQSGVRRLPVTDDAGFLVGILSMGDAVAMTQKKQGTRQRQPDVSVDHVLGMLRKVSGHHAGTASPPAQI